MARCEGTTKEGARCRRASSAGSIFCSWHATQAESEAQRDAAANGAETPDEPDTTTQKTSAKRHPLAGVAVVGIVTIVLLALRRVIRF